MRDDEEPCRYERVHAVQFESFRDDLRELKERVRRLESAIERGVMLLVANLVGIVVTLGQQLMR
jgi:hypothetical protein